MSNASDDAELENLTGAYALDAVSPQEREAMDAAMAASEPLRTEVTELTDTAVELGLAVAPEAPSASLRESVLAGIENVPQVARHDSHLPAEADAVAPTPSRREVRLPAEQKAAARWSRLGVVLASAAAVVALIAGGIAVSHFTNPLTVLASASDSEQVTAEIDGGGTATILWSESVAQSAVTVHGVGQLPGDFVYQLWYIGDEIRSAGTFTRDSTIVLSGALEPGDTIGITIEPAGGSAQPTSDPILAVET